MKSKLRNIVVNNKPFVYWYFSGKSFVLDISPKEDKNIKIEIIYKAAAPDNDPRTFWYFYDIQAKKDDKEVLLNIALPRFIAEIISFLLIHKKELFTKGNHSINATELLSEMGYAELNPVWIGEW